MTVRYGLFINNLVSFLIMALAVFLAIRAINRLQRRAEAAEAVTQEAETAACPLCRKAIDLQASPCLHCISQLEPQPQ